MFATSCSAPVSNSAAIAGITLPPNLPTLLFTTPLVSLLSIVFLTILLNILGVAPLGIFCNASLVILVIKPGVPFKRCLNPIVSNIPVTMASGAIIIFFSFSVTNSKSGSFSISCINLSFCNAAIFIRETCLYLSVAKFFKDCLNLLPKPLAPLNFGCLPLNAA